jgi:hypothetical protein
MQIKFPSSDLVWTVVPTEASRTDASLVILIYMAPLIYMLVLTLVDPVTT